MPAAQSTKAEFKATTSIWDFCPEPFKTDFNISSLDSDPETTSSSLDIFFWLKSVLSGVKGRQAYYDIPFEKEAYKNELDHEYLQKRKRYSWVKYM